MLTRVTIDDENLLRRAHKLSGLKTKRQTVEAALEQFIERHRGKVAHKNRGASEFRGCRHPKGQLTARSA
jgi:Arc/MetJ family transcription regulator